MISNYALVLDPFSLKGPKSFQNQAIQFKLKITQDVIKRDIYW